MGHRGRIALVCLAGVIFGGYWCAGVVLCLGADGHIALEAAGHNHCEHQGEEHGGDAGGGQVIMEDCRPCVDVSLGWAADGKVGEWSRAGYGWAVLAVFGGQVESSHPVEAYPGGYERGGDFEEALRSIVLVI